MDGSSLDVPDLSALTHEDAFAGLVEALLADEREDAPRPRGYVPATALWIVEGDAFVGSLQIQHRLTPFLLEESGHIGSSVRPSARRRGHASAALRDALSSAARLGIQRVLVVCDETNVASRTVIERAGGAHEDSRAGTRRYWIPTG